MSTWWQKPIARAQNTHLPRCPDNILNPITRFAAIAAVLVLGVATSLPLGLAQAATTPVGTTPGSFNVANGAAAYSIPITVPPGVNGLAPGLSLTYSSQGGNGLLGMGWGMGGLSVIHRCGATIEQDGFKGGVKYDANDKFCLDGQRLIHISNGQYRTKRESWNKITASDATTNPESFTVLSKDGTTTQYGATNDSRIEAQGKPDIRVWALNRVEDRSGNYFTVTYSEDNSTGEYRPDRIDYAGNAVIFDYQSRSDVISGYQAGSIVNMSQRLTNIKTYAGGLVRDYRVIYDNNGAMGRSRIISVTECDSDGVCLSPTEFALGESTSSLGTAVITALIGGSTTDRRGWQSLVADFDGDGKSDIAAVQTKAGAGVRIEFSASQGDGTMAAVVETELTDPVQSTCSGDCAAYNSYVGDFNGDGRSDVVALAVDSINCADAQCGTPQLDTVVGLAQADGSFESVYEGMPDGGSLTGYVGKVGDFNGDGRSDVAAVIANNGFRTTVGLSRGDGTFDAVTSTADETGAYSGYVTDVGDVNGDGLADLVAVALGGTGFRARVLLSDGDGTFAYPIESELDTRSWANYVSRIGDFNADGLSDVAAVYTGAAGFHVYVSLGRGDGSFAEPVGARVAAGSYGAYVSEVGDFNGDGLTDVVALRPHQWVTCPWPGSFRCVVQPGWWDPSFMAHVALGAGDGTFEANANMSIGNLDVSRNPEVSGQVGDFNGDGVSDVAVVGIDASVTKAHVALSTGPASDLITQITNGLDAQIDIVYKPITNNDVYTKDNDVTYPYQDIQGAMYVVSEYQASNGIGGLATTSYRYAGAKVHLTGGGLLGFRETTITDPTGIVSTTQFNQTYDGTEGTIASSQTTAAGVLVTSSSNTYGVQNHGGGITFAELQNSITSSYEFNTGLLATQTTSSYVYDTLGCPTSVGVSFNDGYSKTTTNTYNNDQTNWLLCQLTSAQVVSQEPGGDTDTRKSSWTYDGAGRIATEVIEPDLPEFTLTTSYAYDSFGNRLSKTTSGAGVDTRTTSQTYDAQGRFAVSTTNALGHTETYTRDPKHGGLLSQTGPNGFTTTWSYDGLGRKIGETRADGTTSTITYAPVGNSYSITNQSSGAATSTVFYDILERKVRTATEGFDGTLIYQDTQYDALGRVAQTSSPYFSGATPNWTVPAYDALGRVISVATPGNRTTTSSYNGLTTTVANPLGQTKTTVKNSQDKVISVIDAAGTIAYHYDAFGNLLQVTDPGGNITAMQYDIRGRKLSMQDPDMGAWTYRYNVLGELTSQTDAKGQTTTMVYDKLGRMISRTTQEGTSTWAYDSGLYSVGKLVQTTGPGPYLQLHTYDSFGRPSEVTTQYEGGSYITKTTYDAFSRVATSEYPTGFRTRNVYNNTGHLHQILDDNLSALLWQANSVNAKGRLTSETFGNGVNTQVEFDATTGDLARIYSLGGSETLQDLNYLFDAIGNLKQINDARQNLTETFVYDNLNRMTAVSGVVPKSFAYDNLGNMTHKSDVGDYTYGENGAGPHAVTSISGTINASYTYDANGNMTGGNSRTITYTSFNKPQTISANGNTLTLGYDPNYQRIKKTTSSKTTVYLGRYEQVTTGSLNEFKHYIHAGKNLVALYTTRTTGINDTRYFHPDHLNSIDTITDELGNVVERLSYDAYGKRRQANWQDATSTIISLSNRGYTGHKHDDEVGLINMRARLYDPVLGRFLQPDTIIPGPTHSQSYNRYTYCGNNPISHIDPTGHFLHKIFKGVRRVFKKVAQFVNRAWRNPYVRMAAAVAASFFTGGAAAAAWGPIAGGAAGGAAFGFVASGGNLRAAFAGAATGAAFGWVGDLPLHGFEKIGAHALTGGITSEATGGDFRSGFFGAGIAGFARTNWSIPAKVTLRAVAGGIGAELAGGKFRNGATTAAFAYLFNETLHKNFGELSYSKRRAKWEEFIEKRDEIVAGWNKPYLSWPSLSRSGWGFVRYVLKTGTAYQNWQSERFEYELGVDSLEAHRLLPGFNERPTAFGPVWAQVNWRSYDFGGSTRDTIDFYYWANERTRPSNCFFAWNC